MLSACEKAFEEERRGYFKSSYYYRANKTKTREKALAKEEGIKW